MISFVAVIVPPQPWWIAVRDSGTLGQAVEDHFHVPRLFHVLYSYHIYIVVGSNTPCITLRNL